MFHIEHLPAAPATHVGGRRRKPSLTAAERHRKHNGMDSPPASPTREENEAEVRRLMAAIQDILGKEAANKFMHDSRRNDHYRDLEHTIAQRKALDNSAARRKSGAVRRGTNLDLGKTHQLFQPRQGF